MARDAFADAYDRTTRDLFVVNTEASNEHGEHWLAVWRRSANRLAFFDSYGLFVELYPDVMRTIASPSTTISSRSLSIRLYSLWYVWFHCIVTPVVCCQPQEDL